MTWDDENLAEDLDEAFLDEETLRLAQRYEQYRREYNVGDLKGAETPDPED